MCNNVVFLIFEPGHFRELFRLVLLTKKNKSLRPYIVFAAHYGGIEPHVNKCMEENVPYYFADSNISITKTGSQAKVTIQNKFKFFGVNPFTLSKPFRFLFFRFYDFLRFITRRLGKGFIDYIREMRNAKKTLNAVSPNILILAEDNVGHGTEIWVHLAKNKNISTIIVPYTICNALEIANHYEGVSEYSFSRMENKLVGTLFPKWSYQHKGKWMLRLMPARILAIELFGRSPPNPWMINSGHAAAIAVESLKMKSFYMAEGLPESQLTLTGAIYNDILKENLAHLENNRKKLFQNLNLPQDKPMLLCALPPPLNERIHERTEFKSYNKLLEFLAKNLGLIKNYNIVCCLHPQSNFDNLMYLEQFGIKLTKEDTATLVPICDIYIASVSATIRWAIACGKPVINYDPFNFKYIDYKDAKGCLLAESSQNFISLLTRLTSDKMFYDHIQSIQQSEMESWGKLDGHAGNRLLDLIEKNLTHSTRTLNSTSIDKQKMKAKLDALNL